MLRVRAGETLRTAFYCNYLNMPDLQLRETSEGTFVVNAGGLTLDEVEHQTALELAVRCGIDYEEVK